MKRLLTAALLAALMTGCTAIPASPPGPPTQPTLTVDPPVQGQPPQPPPASSDGAKGPTDGPPPQAEVCITPESKSDISITLGRPASDAFFKVYHGWTVPWPTHTLLGWVHFPAPVDHASVKVTVEPDADWVLAENDRNQAEDSFGFVFAPSGTTGDPRRAGLHGEPGWMTLKVEGAKDKQGNSLQTEPITVKLFRHTSEMAKANPYLGKCLKETPPKDH